MRAALDGRVDSEGAARALAEHHHSSLLHAQRETRDVRELCSALQTRLAERDRELDELSQRLERLRGERDSLSSNLQTALLERQTALDQASDAAGAQLTAERARDELSQCVLPQLREEVRETRRQATGLDAQLEEVKTLWRQSDQARLALERQVKELAEGTTHQVGVFFHLLDRSVSISAISSAVHHIFSVYHQLWFMLQSANGRASEHASRLEAQIASLEQQLAQARGDLQQTRDALRLLDAEHDKLQVWIVMIDD